MKEITIIIENSMKTNRICWKLIAANCGVCRRRVISAECQLKQHVVFVFVVLFYPFYFCSLCLAYSCAPTAPFHSANRFVRWNIYWLFILVFVAIEQVLPPFSVSRLVGRILRMKFTFKSRVMSVCMYILPITFFFVCLF